MYDGAREVLERRNLALLALLLAERFTLADDLAAIVEDVSVLVAGTASAILDIAFDKTSDDGAVVVGDVAGLVALEALEGRIVCRRG